MEDTSTPQKPRSKTADFAGFLRGMGQQTSQRTPEPGALQVPEAGVRRRKSSLITFLGRTRKKSSVSSISDSVSAEQPDVRDFQRSSEAHDQPFPSTSTPHSSFGSLLAAHFSGSARRGAVKRTDASTTGYSSDSFLEHPRVRRSSVDSTLRAGSTTPQPTITVSPSSHLFDDQYDDLFTKPTRKRISLNPTHPRSPSPSHQDAPSQSSTHPPSPPTVFLRDSRRESGSIRSARNSRLSGMEDPTSGEESEAVSTLSLPMSASAHRRSWDSQNRRFSSTSVRSKSTPRTAPPTIPLPSPPPVEALPAAPVNASISRTSSVGRTSSVRKARPRSLTLSSRASVSPVPTPTVSSSPPKTRKSQERKSTEDKSDKENEVFDIYTASADQLRTALLARNHQLDELAAYLLKVTQNHVTEKNALEKRIAALERDAAKRDKEIKGLTWLVSNGRSPGASVAGNTLLSTASRSTSALADISPVVISPSYRHLHTDPEDSGGETSKTDSMRESFDLSGGESSSSVPVRVEGMKQFSKTSSRTAPLIKGMSSRGGGGFRPITVERVPISDIRTSRRLDKRSSVSSFASSATSSSSSVMPSSPTAATLSSIPEAGSPPPTPPEAKAPSSRDPAIVAAISTQRREKEQKKNTPRSTSKATSTTSSAPTPAAAYAANLQRSRPRPRSIGQILDFTNTSSSIPPSSSTTLKK